MGQTTWSDPQVVEKSKKFVCVSIDPRNDPKGVGGQFGVRGVPDVRFLDSSGKELFKVADRSAAGVMRQMDQALEQSKPPVVEREWITDWDEAQAQAEETGKALLVVLVTEDSDGEDFLSAVQAEAAAPLLDNFICVKVIDNDDYKNTPAADALKGFGIRKGQAVVAFRGSKRFLKLTKLSSPDKFVKDLQKAVDKSEK